MRQPAFSCTITRLLARGGGLLESLDCRAGLDAFLREPARRHFERKLRGSRRTMRSFGLRLHVGDADDFSLFVDKSYRQRDQRILHPHAVRFGLWKYEKHALVRTEMLAKHEALRPCLEGVSDLSPDEVNPSRQLQGRQLRECDARGNRRGGAKERKDPIHTG